VFIGVGENADLTDEAEVVTADLAGADALVELRRYPGGHGWDTWTPALGDGLRALVTSLEARP
jgi:enterochelin esterase-like enzyme